MANISKYKFIPSRCYYKIQQLFSRQSQEIVTVSTKRNSLLIKEQLKKGYFKTRGAPLGYPIGVSVGVPLY